jgi:hypothetical protein
VRNTFESSTEQKAEAQFLRGKRETMWMRACAMRIGVARLRNEQMRRKKESEEITPTERIQRMHSEYILKRHARAKQRAPRVGRASEMKKTKASAGWQSSQARQK